jgi:predicted short-subunit dehydrogenase-like oxidoreductase (DUF2520 family)
VYPGGRTNGTQPGPERRNGGCLPALRLIGPGRAGRSLVAALTRAGWSAPGRALGRGDDVRAAAHGVDLLLIATPDAAIAGVAAAVEPDPACVVVHLAGSLGLDVLAPHPRRAALHPLVAIPDAETRLEGAWFAVAGDPLAAQVVDDLDGHAFAVPDDRRTLYHAAAAVASNHLVALLAQAERIAAEAGVPFEAYEGLVRQTVENVFTQGPAKALTGPVKRGDWATVERHLAALPEAERAGYAAMVEEAKKCR